MSADRCVLLSVRPQYAHALLAGTKTAEVRRRFPDLDAGTILFVYSSSPERKVIGTLRLKAVHQLHPTTVWQRFKRMIGIDQAYLDDYLRGASNAAIVEVDEPQQWSETVTLQQLRDHLGLEPAQSYRYLDLWTAEQLEEIRSLDSGVTNTTSPAWTAA
ncbi:ASCH domain-containing protein [Curtobacterium flaccumfaciens]|uniref:ASCH domain-containing protein n=1 Tax=Curtobacterium poinsettiae TaxID=159612 RepID=A0A9Q9T3E5_9MICO|nr:ASCH domain-containing protein [Curtobacterium flaccumfaciens]UXN26572.1 ASCH domain-containing protein [Curtobacterium flaccumfaciens]UYC81414.1 ASCH domain-containing protein [Curtobacterium flaccumfaciens pv. poinsettiae]